MSDFSNTRSGRTPEMADLSEAVERNDPDELLRLVDGLCNTRSWDDLVMLDALCIEALDRGKQLWGVSAHIHYRLALEAPALFAGPVITERASRFLLGPLPEVAASTHEWRDLADHIPVGPARSVAAHERVIRGEDLRHADAIDQAVLEIPLVLEAWEPKYAVAEYRSDKAHFPMPDLPPINRIELPSPAARLEDDAAVDGLTALVEPWAASSNGNIDVAVVGGDAFEAIAALGLRQAAATELTTRQAMALMAWAGASGGAYAPRQGAASGRFGAWWAAACVTGQVDDWPVAGEDLAAACDEVRWFAWSDLFPSTGWGFHLAAHDPLDGLAWAISATDAA